MNIDNPSKRQKELSQPQLISDIRAYAQDWADLAAAFEYSGFWYSAERCKSDAIRYYNMPAGEYVRLIDAPLVELIFVEAS